ncbi:MAG: insulinase family protein [Bacteroidales bacterium]|nr:insulinase family protein [Bacteroidales bacterium]
MTELQTLTLPNGLRIVHQNTSTGVAYCGFMVDCGTRHEQTAADFGMAHFVEHILFKGTRKRDAWHINQRLESVGGELNAFTTKEDTTFYAAFLPQDFAIACELLCDLICHPTAPQHELEKEREVVLDEIDSYRDTPADLIYDVFEDRLFAGTPLGHNILGSEATVRTFDHDRCISFIGRNYRPERMVFFAYGPMPWTTVVRLLTKHFDLAATASDMKNRVAADANAATGVAQATADATFGAQHQAHCMLGCKAYPIGHKDAAALSLINNMLGGPGMNSRLNQQLREKRGLVYTVESTLTRFTDTGYFSIYFGCDHDDADRCLHLCRKELRRLIDQPLSPRQLKAAQKQFKGQMGIGTANLENNALSLAKSFLRLGRVETLADNCARIDAVTSEQIQRVASELFADGNLLEVRSSKL